MTHDTTPGYLDEYAAFRRQPGQQRRTHEEMEALKVKMKPLVLDLYRRGGTFTAIRETLNLHRVAIDRWRKEDPEFDQDLREAALDFAESLEDEAYRRAVVGVDEPVYQAGKRVTEADPITGKEILASVRKYDTQLLIVLMKGNNPEKYKDKFSVTHGVEVPRAESSPEQVEAVRQLLIGRPPDGGGESQIP